MVFIAVIIDKFSRSVREYCCTEQTRRPVVPHVLLWSGPLRIHTVSLFVSCSYSRKVLSMAVMVVENVRPRETIRPGTRVEGRSRSSGDGRDVVRRTFDCHVRYVHVDAAALNTVVDQRSRSDAPARFAVIRPSV